MPRWASAVLLLESAKRDDVKAMHSLIESGADINCVSVDCLHQTSLHFAAAAGHVQTVAALLKRGALIDAADTLGKTPCHEAARGGHTAALRALISSGAALEKRDSLGRSPLRHAAEGGHTSCVEVLLEAGADKDDADDEGRTSLHDAAWRGHENIVEALVLAGADKQAAERKTGRTPATLAEEAGHVSLLPLLDEDLARKQAKAERLAFANAKCVHVISAREERPADLPWACNPSKVATDVKEYVETQATSLPDGTKVFNPNGWPNGADEHARVTTDAGDQRDPGEVLLNWIIKIEQAESSGGALIQVVIQGGLSHQQQAEEKLARRHGVQVIRLMCDDMEGAPLSYQMRPKLMALEDTLATLPKRSRASAASALGRESIEIRVGAGDMEQALAGGGAMAGGGQSPEMGRGARKTVSNRTSSVQQPTTTILGTDVNLELRGEQHIAHKSSIIGAASGRYKPPSGPFHPPPPKPHDAAPAAKPEAAAGAKPAPLGRHASGRQPVASGSRSTSRGR